MLYHLILSMLFDEQLLLKFYILSISVSYHITVCFFVMHYHRYLTFWSLNTREYLFRYPM